MFEIPPHPIPLVIPPEGGGPTWLTADSLSLWVRMRRTQRIVSNTERVETLVGPRPSAG